MCGKVNYWKGSMHGKFTQIKGKKKVQMLESGLPKSPPYHECGDKFNATQIIPSTNKKHCNQKPAITVYTILLNTNVQYWKLIEYFFH